MPIRFLHTADIHLGKTYRGSPGETERFADFFRCLAGIVADAIREEVDCVLIAGDLFHTGQILPRTFAATIEVLQPLKDAGIPCVAVEGNHDWIHRRDSISWMEAHELGCRPGVWGVGEDQPVEVSSFACATLPVRVGDSAAARIAVLGLRSVGGGHAACRETDATRALRRSAGSRTVQDGASE
jgi:hypothetical protein